MEVKIPNFFNCLWWWS